MPKTPAAERQPGFEAIQKEIRLTGVKFHDELLVDDGSNLFLGRHAGNLARELVTVAFQPVRNHSSLSQVKETGNQLLGRSLAAYGNDVARTAGVGRDIRLLAVHGDVTVGNKLTGAGTGIAEAEAVHNIVQTKLKELKQNIAGNAAAAGGFCIILAELTFKHTVLETQFLFSASITP